MPDNYVELNRRFAQSTDESVTENVVVRSYTDSQYFAQSTLSWNDLLQNRVVIVLGEPGSGKQKWVFSDIQACRTAVMGGHVRACNDCGHREISYNSCRNRHCPKCQAMARARWLVQREAELLPIPYFHIVFTLPAEIAAVALQNKRLLYGMLFKAASETLMQVAANPRHLGAAQIGVLAVLHTWGQNLMHHPHLHCVVGGGGLSQDESRWIASRDYYFLPVKVLSRVFRNTFCRLLEKAFQRGELGFYGKSACLAAPRAFRDFLDAAVNREWVVYAKRPFREPACVLKYLARYTHRVAISNRRLVDYRDGKVTFRYKDYARQSAPRMMTLAAAACWAAMQQPHRNATSIRPTLIRPQVNLACRPTKRKPRSAVPSARQAGCSSSKCSTGSHATAES